MNEIMRTAPGAGALGWLRALAMLLVALGWSASGHGAGREFEVSPAPAWVLPQTPDLGAQAPAGQVADGSHYLLVDHQVRVDRNERVLYRHVATRALNESGVQAIANVEIRFDPSFQRLTLHAVQVRRGAQIINRLKPSAVRVLQRETELEALIFDGSRTAHVFLEDVRVGDVVEYAYSVRGHNPVFGGRQFGRIDLQWGVPVTRAHARLLWPQGRELKLQYRNKAAPATLTEGPGQREYRWDVRDIPALRVEKDAPGWHDPFAGVSWSEFADWGAVADWALPLYRLPERPTPRVAAAIAEIAQAQAGAGERLLAALRYVQANVRYLGVEIGANSHAPNPPDLVLQRRFGDCKDKTLLTVALLRGLGIAAYPALVNTGLQRAIADSQATPGAFNHVVVHARLDGRDLWLDPTRAPQAGELGQLVQAEYGPALRIDAGVVGLSAMAGEDALTNRREVRAEFDSRGGPARPVPFTVSTITRGAAADHLRGTLATQSGEGLQKGYTNFYAARYDGLSVASPMEISDDKPANRLTVTEHYVVDSFWRRAEGRQRREAEVLVPDMAELLRAPQTTVRQAPLHTGHPIDVLHVTRVHLTPGFDIKADEQRVEDPAFELHRSTRMEGDTLVLTDRFKTRLAQVEAADVPRYAGNLDKARQALAYTLYEYDQGVPRRGGAPYWLPAVVATLALLGGAALARRLYFWNPPAPAPGALPFAAGPRGLGGWLLLPALGLVASFLRVAGELRDSWPAYEATQWLSLTTPGAATYRPIMEPLLLFELVANILALVGIPFVLLLFARRRTSLPRAYCVLVLGMAAASLLDMLLVPADLGPEFASSRAWGRLAGQLIGVAIWVSYFHRSERVRNTFVERLPSPAQPPPASAAPALA